MNIHGQSLSEGAGTGWLTAPAHRGAHELLADALGQLARSPGTAESATLITSRKPGPAAIPAARDPCGLALDSSLQRSSTESDDLRILTLRFRRSLAAAGIAAFAAFVDRVTRSTGLDPRS
jgi:hypothetical protein